MMTRLTLIGSVVCFGLGGCTSASPTKVLPGSNFSTSCFTQRFGDRSSCDSQAKAKCDTPPISTEVVERKNGEHYSYSVFYRCP